MSYWLECLATGQRKDPVAVRMMFQKGSCHSKDPVAVRILSQSAQIVNHLVTLCHGPLPPVVTILYRHPWIP